MILQVSAVVLEYSSTGKLVQGQNIVKQEMIINVDVIVDVVVVVVCHSKHRKR